MDYENLIRKLEKATTNNIQLESTQLLIVDKESLEERIMHRAQYYELSDLTDRYVIVRGKLAFMCHGMRFCDLEKAPSADYCRLLTDFPHYDYIRKKEAIEYPPQETVPSRDKAVIAYTATVLAEENYIRKPDWLNDESLILETESNIFKRSREECDSRALKFNLYSKREDIKRV